MDFLLGYVKRRVQALAALAEHPYVCIIVFFGVFYFFCNWQLPVTDPVESNYVQTAREMLQSGDYVSPQIFGHYWYDKPALYYWELMLAMQVFGQSDFVARLVSGVMSIAVLCTTYRFALHLYSRRVATLAVLILGTAAGYWYVSKSILTDMTLMLFFCGTLMAFYVAWERASHRWYLLCFVLAGFGVLTKGPIAFLLPGFVYFVFLCVRREPGKILHIGWMPGILIFGAIVAMWYGPMYLLHGQDFLASFLGTHNFLRATVAEHPKYNVWYYYGAIFLAAMLPWSLVMFYGLRRHWQELRHSRPAPQTVYLLVWAVTVTLFYQCMATKYPTYTLPSLLPAAILIARLVEDKMMLCWRVFAVWSVVLCVLTVAVMVPFSHYRSGQQMAALVQSYLPVTRAAGQAKAGRAEPLLLAYYGGSYEVSFSYYLHGWPVYDLQPDAAAIADKRPIPGVSSWRDKNIQPYLAITDLAAGQQLLVICDEEKTEQFRALLPAGTTCQPRGAVADLKLFYVALPQ